MRRQHRGWVAAVLAPVAAHAAPPPGSPSGLSAAIVDGVVELSWDAPAEDAASVTGYHVLRRRPGVDAVGAFHMVADDTATTDTSFADVCARDAGASYTYRVKAWRDGELSGRSRYRRINLRDDFVAAEDVPDCDPDTGVIADSGDAGTDADDAQLLGIVAGTQGGAVVDDGGGDTDDSNSGNTADSDNADAVEDVCAQAGTPAAEEQGSGESESVGVYRIAYASPGDAFSIRVMDADGSNQTMVTSHSSDVHGTEWSPDGTKIAFSSKSTDDEIFVINSDGTAKQRLTDNDVDDWAPAFSPDGSQIAYVTNDGDREIAVT